MAKTRTWLAAVTLSSLVGTLLAGAPPAAAGARPDNPGSLPGQLGPAAAVGTVAGQGSASAQQVSPSAVSGTGERAGAGTTDAGPLGSNGQPTGAALPSRASGGAALAGKPVPAPPSGPGVPNQSGSPSAVPLAAPTTVNNQFDGVNQAGGGGAQPPDANAAIGTTQIMQAVNRRISVFPKTSTSGAASCTNTLAGWFGQPGTVNVYSPRVQYDNLNNRFIAIATTRSTSSAPAQLFLGVSRTGDACGGWFVYSIFFIGSAYPLGSFLDYPHLGQDRVALLLSSNQFSASNAYLNSTAFAIPKATVYAGGFLLLTAFLTDFASAPVVVAGIPIPATSASYYVAAVPGTGYRLWRMTNTAANPPTYALQATITDPFAAPSRRVSQCGTSTTLDPLDGRIAWQPYQNGSFVWFTHGIDLGGFPGVRYGAINVDANAAATAVAFRSETSDDFNPSITVHPAGPDVIHAWLNWASTDTGAVPCANTSVNVDGVLPGTGVPNLLGTSLVLVTGSATTTNTRFGGYSSVSVDPVAASGTCPAGRTAALAQEYFVSGSWATRIARVSFC